MTSTKTSACFATESPVNIDKRRSLWLPNQLFKMYPHITYNVVLFIWSCGIDNLVAFFISFDEELKKTTGLLFSPCKLCFLKTYPFLRFIYTIITAIYMFLLVQPFYVKQKSFELTSQYFAYFIAISSLVSENDKWT